MLFYFLSGDGHYNWALIELVQHECSVVDRARTPAKAGCEMYENAKLRINTDKEDMVRGWLNRPKVLSDKQQWINAVSKLEWDNTQQQQALLLNTASYPDKEADDVIAALLATKSLMASDMTLRALSAKCFWGDSKFLDKRLGYLTELFPIESANIQPRKLLINVYIPDEFSSVVLVENQDTFLMLANHAAVASSAGDPNLHRTAFVYCAGFKGSASRIRDEGNTAFSFLSATNSKARIRFTNWWTHNDAVGIDVYFWGDLDYSGLAILAALQSIFPGIKAWQTGYAPMVHYYRKGIRHPKQSANKEKQLPPAACGCEYADTVLLLSLIHL